VSIISPRDALRVGRKMDVVCQTKGAVPPARVTWSLGGRLLRDAK
jgi:hypothetical protein